MKNILLFCAVACLFIACTNSPKEKADKLVKQWVSENNPSVTYEPINQLIPIDFTDEELAYLAHLQTELDSAQVYETMAINQELDEDALALVDEGLGSLIDELNEQMKQAALENVWRIEGEMEDYKEQCKPKEEGEKGYKAYLPCMVDTLRTEIIFYFNTVVEQVDSVKTD